MPSLTILTKQVLDAFLNKNQKSMRKVNDRILDEATIEFSPELYSLAVASYALSKILSKPRYYKKEYKEGFRRIEQVLRHMVKVAKNEEKYRHARDNLEESILNLESRDRRYVSSLMDKGKLKMAAILYAQGVSLGLASESTGIPPQEILDYAGKTMMFDRLEEPLSLKERKKLAKKMLEGKK